MTKDRSLCRHRGVDIRVSECIKVNSAATQCACALFKAVCLKFV